MARKKLSKIPPNALRHGAFAGTIILPDEDPDEFKRLHRDLIEEWSPSGPAEEDAVFTLAKCMWRKRRIGNLRDPVAPDDRSQLISTLLISALEGEFGDAPADERVLRELFRTCSDDDLRLLAEIVADMQEAVRQVTGSDNSEAGPDRDKGSKPDLLLAKTLHFARGFSITRVTKELALEEHLDRMIDRALRRLGQIKAMKEVIAFKQGAAKALAQPTRRIAAPAIEPAG